MGKIEHSPENAGKKKAMQARAKMILSEGEEEASRRLVDAGNSFHANDVTLMTVTVTLMIAVIM